MSSQPTIESNPACTLQTRQTPWVPSPAASIKARVLHVINGEHYSGAERVQDLLASALPEFGYEAGWACLKQGLFREKRVNRTASLYQFDMSSRFDWRVQKEVTAVVRNENWDAIHAHTPRSLLVAAAVARRTDRPLIYHVHSPVGRDSTRRFANWLNARVERWLLKRADKLICVSHSLHQYMREQGHAAERLAVVQNGVPATHALPKRNAPEGTWILGTTALFRPRKGTEVLLRAVAQLRKAGCDVRLLAVGPFETVDYERELKSLAEELEVSDHIDWLGFQSDVNSLFQKMDLFVLPSLFGEGLPMVVLEAMANGAPVIASTVEGIPEAIRHEQDGLTFAPGDEQTLAEQVKRVVTGQVSWDALRLSAWSRQRQQFSDRSMARQLAAIYESLLRD